MTFSRRPHILAQQAIYACFLALLALHAALHAQSTAPAAASPNSGPVPVHVLVSRTVNIHLGDAVYATTTADIYTVDHVSLPAKTVLRGTVSGFDPVARLERTKALLNGDVTPLHEPVVHFVAATLPDGRGIPFEAIARVRSTQMVNFVSAGKRPSLLAQGKAMVRERIRSTHDALFTPGKRDRAVRLLYAQLPYHPQRLWAGTQLIADWNTTATPPPSAAAAASAAPLNTAASLDKIDIVARLTTPLTSKSAAKGEDVSAIVTQPVLAPDHTLLIAEGSTIHGVVLSSRAARSFGRNGALHFAIRSIDRNGADSRHVQGTVAGAEGSRGENITVDSEGNVQSTPPKDRFLAPLLLAVTAAAGHDDDHDHHGGTGSGGNLGGETIASNGFGLIARVVTLTVQDPNVASGFGYFALAKSITFRFLLPGHEVTFPRDTLVKVRLAEREH